MICQSSKGWQIVCWRRQRRLWWGVSDGAAPGGRVAKTVQCHGAVRCRGKVVAKCYGYDWAVLRAAHKDGLCVPWQVGEEVEGGEEEVVVEDPNGVSIEESAHCLLLLRTTTGHFLLSGWRNGRDVIAPLTNEDVGGVAGHPAQCSLAKVCHGEALPWPSLQGHVGIRVPPGCILVVRKGLYGGVARVAPEVKGVAHVPFVNRPFESEIHGTVNFTQFCCVLLVTWCYRVLLSCYLRPKSDPTNVCNLQV